jgi:primosomal protein N' (replication factor Y)
LFHVVEYLNKFRNSFFIPKPSPHPWILSIFINRMLLPSRYVKVLLPVSPNNGIFTYAVPPPLEPFVGSGKRVLVPFHTNRLLTGLVLDEENNPPENIRVRRVEDVLDEYPLIGADTLQFWQWLSQYYCCSMGEVMAAALPSVLRIESESILVHNESFDAFAHPGVIELLSDEEKIFLNALRLLPDGMKLPEARKKLGMRRFGNLLASNLIVSKENYEDPYKPLLEKYVRILFSWDDEKAVATLFDSLSKKSPRQLEVLMLLASLRREAEMHEGWMPVKKLTARQASPAAIEALVKKNLLQSEQFESERLPVQEAGEQVPPLSEEQQVALEEIKQHIHTKPVLLYGVTGSGKTEVISHLVTEVLNKGKQILYLLPEIALTRFLRERLRKYFGDRVFVYHSRISHNERAEIWKKATSGVPMLLVGPRSALLVPLPSAGMLVVDEEHDAGYKQHEPAPRFQARDAAVYLAASVKIPILLASATPSAESYYNVKTGKYALVELNHRFAGNVLPRVIIDDLNKSRFSEGPSYLGKALQAALEETLSRGEQAILFQNRRGFSVQLECNACTWTPGCENCNVSLTYHKGLHLLRCHYCGYSSTPPLQCKQCGREQMQTRGTGTEKIEEELSILFPAYKTARLDLDTARSRHAFQQIVQAFGNGETSILVGTQMLSKGLDFSRVSLAGVINADSLLSYPDFRATERAWQLLVQVSGRSGRALTHGRVIVQTRKPENPFFAWIAEAGRYKEFLDYILREREEYAYPPFARLIEITVKHKQQEAGALAARNLVDELTRVLPLPVLGPAVPYVNRIRQYFLFSILVKSDRQYPAAHTKKQILHITLQLLDSYKDKGLRISIDADPY